jgi:cytoskeleton-associated protein 5
MRSNHSSPSEPAGRPHSVSSSRPISPVGSSANHQQSPPSHRTSPSVSSQNGFSLPMEEPDPEAQLIAIINHISSETTGAMHKEGITELHQFLKNYPHKRPRVEKLLETTGPAFRKYINRALASRAAEDMERNVAVASTLSSMVSSLSVFVLPELESNGHESPSMPDSAAPPREDMSPQSAHHTSDPPGEDRLHQLHGIFHYSRASTTSNGSSQSAMKPQISES